LPTSSESSNDRRQITLFDATCIMMGIVIGAGIFSTPPKVAALSSSAAMLLALWIAGGVASLLGALCFAELAARYPEHGGTYAFVHRAFGPQASFLFAWTDFWIVRPGNLGVVSLILAEYANGAFPLGDYGRIVYALSSVLLATGVHLWGFRLGRWTQNLLTTLKVVGLLQIILAAATMSSGLVAVTATSGAAATSSAPPWQSWAIAFTFVMFCFGGWSDLSYVAAEVKNPGRNMLWAMVLGISAITALYVAVNAGALYVLGLQGLAQSEAFAAEVLDHRLATLTLGNRNLSIPIFGSQAIGLLVAISCLGALSGMVFTGARIYYALGLKHLSFAWLGGWNLRRSTPPQSLAAQATIACGLLLLAGSDANGFERLVIFAAPCYWGFTLLAVAALPVLRLRDRQTPLPFRVPLYPLAPLLFAAVCGVLVVSSTLYVLEHFKWEAIYSLVVLAAGIAVGWWTVKRQR
jgi:basic amino acid/polyamine antiporter, APA family